jgi:hypothetical protein
MKSLVKISAVLAFAALAAQAPTMTSTAVSAASGPQLQSIGPISFGPNGVLFAADSVGAAIFALDLGSQATGGAPGTANVTGLDQKVAAALGTDAREVAIADLAVDQRTKNSYLSVMRGQGPAAKAALVRVDGAGKISVINMDAVQFTSVTLPNLPAPGGEGRANQRAQAITQVRYSNGKVWVSGVSNEEFASKLWSVAYPFSKADGGTSLEIYHDNHQRLETRAPMYAFMPYTLDNQAYIIGAYTCTPLVKFPVSQLTPNSGSKFRGTTIGEFGAGNRPIDMILYKKGGKDFILMANTSRGVMKIPTDTFASATPLTMPSNQETAGVPFEKIPAMQNVVQLDLLDATHGIVVQGAQGQPLNLQSVELP